jgi:hypothetical protein
MKLTRLFDPSNPQKRAPELANTITLSAFGSVKEASRDIQDSIRPYCELAFWRAEQEPATFRLVGVGTPQIRQPIEGLI